MNRFLYRNTQNTISKSYLSLLQRAAEIAFISYIFGVINVLIMHDFKYSIISNSLGESSVCTACHAETDERYVQGAILPACNEQRKSFLPPLITENAYVWIINFFKGSKIFTSLGDHSVWTDFYTEIRKTRYQRAIFPSCNLHRKSLLFLISSEL